MAWQQKSGVDASSAVLSSNPWFSASSAASTSRTSPLNAFGNGAGSGTSTSGAHEDPLSPASKSRGVRNGHHKYRTTDDALGLGIGANDIEAEATRPSLNRLTSNGLKGLLHGLDRLGVRSNNASMESISTQDDSGSRRSLDELRRMSIKGKSRASMEGDGWAGHLGSLDGNGREALLHNVEKGDSLVGMALLYGCTAQAIRTANKLWLNDPIQLRKTLYIPLDACTQPPSREVEFVQKSGEDVVHLYFRAAAASTSGQADHSTASRLSGSGNHEGRASSLRYNNSSYHDTTPNEQSPLSSTRSSFSQASTSKAAYTPYLSSTNSEYTSSSEHLPSDTTSSGYGSPPASAGLPLAVDPLPPPSSLTRKKTVQILRMPGSNTSKSVTKGKSALISVDDLPSQAAGDSTLKKRASKDTILATSSASLLTPCSSSDRLSSLVPGFHNAANLRMRPRSPWEDAQTPNATLESPEPGSVVPSPRLSQAGSPSIPSSPAFPPRKRKTSNAVPPNNPATKPVKAVNNLVTAGAGLIGSFLGGTKAGGSGGKKWLAMDEFQDEMELAKEYQDSRTRRVSQTVPVRRGPTEPGTRTRAQDIFKSPGVS